MLRVKIPRELIEKIGSLLYHKNISVCAFDPAQKKVNEKTLLDERYEGVNIPHMPDSPENFRLMEIWGEETQARVKEIFNQEGLDFAVQA